MTEDIDHLIQGVLCTVLHLFRTCNSERWPLAAPFGSALSAEDIDDPVQGVLCTVFRHFCTCNSELWPLATPFGSALSTEDVERPIQGVLCTVNPRNGDPNDKKKRTTTTPNSIFPGEKSPPLKFSYILRTPYSPNTILCTPFSILGTS